MKKNRISFKSLLFIFVVILILTHTLTYVLLMSKNAEWKTLMTEKEDKTAVVAEALLEHVYYDGESIPCNQEVRHYSRSGKLIGSNNISDVLNGDKVVILFSTNCCSACAKGEIEKIQELAKKIGREHIVVIADFAMHMHSSWTLLFDKEGYYETEMEHLGLEGSPTKETPLLLFTQNGRIKTSFVLGSQTSRFVNEFHEYLVDYYKDIK